MSAPSVALLPVHGVKVVRAEAHRHTELADRPFAAVEITVGGGIGLRLFLSIDRADYADRLAAAINAAQEVRS